MKHLVSAVGLVLTIAVTASAQILSGSLSGAVTDPSGHVIVGASVILTSEVSDEERFTATNEVGDFIFTGLAPGSYMIRVEAKGFRALERKNSIVGAAARLAVGKLQLEVGALAESVTVSAQGQPVATTTTSQQAVLDSKQVLMISVRGRDPISLLRLIPAVQQGVDSDSFGGSYAVTAPKIAGGVRNTFYVDGVNAGDQGDGANFSGATNLDAIGEVNVQVGAYTAEYGLKSGAQINYITKRGGDRFHGAAYWYDRNEFFNANSWLGNHTNQRRPIYRYSTLGGNLGGPVPVKIPLLNPKGHQLFFFYSLDDTQTKEPQPINRWTLPSVLERQGDFSQSRATSGSLITVKDPSGINAPFPNNVIPSTRLSAASVAMMNILPTPNAQGAAGYNFITQEPSLDHPRRQHLYRFDLRPTNKDSFSIKHQTWYTKSAGIGVAAGASNWGLVPLHYDFTADIGNVAYTRIISPSILDEFSIGVFYSTENGPARDQAALDRILRSTYLALSGLRQFAPQNNPLGIIPWVNVGALPNASFYGTGVLAGETAGSNRTALIWYDGRYPLTGATTAFPITDNLTYVRGSHTFKAGVMREFERLAKARRGNFAGQFDFSNDSNDPGTTGYAFANMYIGHLQKYSEQLGRVGNNRYQTTWAFFVQDSWKVHRRLTVDIGLRIYKWNPPLNGGGEASAFTFERYDPTWGGHPPVLFKPVLTAQGRGAQNPLTGEILPASYIGLMAPGTGYGCNTAITPKAPCIFNGIVVQNDPTYVQGHGFNDPLPLQYDPRFGLAWDVFGDGKMAVRSSFGAFHDGTSGNLYEGGPAFQFQKDILYTDMNSYMTDSSATPPTSVTGNWRVGAKRPVTYEYTLAIQRDIGWHTVLDVAYFGSTTHHILQSWNFNALPAGVRFLPSSQDPTAPGKPLPDVFLRPITGFGDILVSGPATTSRYDSLQVQGNRRFVRGIELVGTFTYAGGTSNGWRQNNPLPSSAARSRNALVQQLVLNLSYVVDVPHGSRLIKVPASKWILDNWQLSGITTLANGVVSDVSLSTTDGFDFTGGGESCGVVQTGNAALPRSERTVDRWFNTSVFHRPSGRGDIGNNCNNAKFRLPGFNNHDASLFKNFPIKEGKVLQLRWEVYNLLNHTQSSSVDTTAQFNPAGVMTNSNFGKVTDARPERRMQFALRFSF
jgi:hypothetical protein